IDRGGQVTFHGPGQLMVYPLIDIRRANIGVRKLVTALEQSVVDLAADYEVGAAARADAPGVYVGDDKLASVGLRIRRGSSFHGMALNVDVDLEPFTRINPCGYAELEMTDLHRLGIALQLEDTAEKLLPYFLRHLD
ncbi:MAG: lipoyl(octanoyl) transferase, partial [Chromatiales bacterium]